MSELPRYIADLCGIIDQRTNIPSIGRPETSSPLQMVQDKDGVWIVTFDNNEIGWITRVTISNRLGQKYRAVTNNGVFKHCESLTSARSFIMEEYH